jgi:chloramphenicol-sensitive protein RarD
MQLAKAKNHAHASNCLTGAIVQPCRGEYHDQDWSSLVTSPPSPSRVFPSEGIVYALLAYVSWGLFPLYWKLFGATSLLEILCHRMIWSVVFLGVLVLVWRKTAEVRAVLRQGRILAALLLTASLLTANWGFFIYGVASEQVVQTSLGYFLNPLVSILLGRFFLKEGLTRRQKVAVGLAAAGVIQFGWGLGQIPWIAIGLATTFAFYGLIRKIVAVTPLVGLLVETGLMTPLALALVLNLSIRDQTTFGGDPRLTLLYLGTGVVTALPLMWYHHAVKQLPFSLMGILQYLAPSLQLLVGVMIFKEEFPARQGFAFVLIWIAIAIYLSSLVRGQTKPLAVPSAD